MTSLYGNRGGAPTGTGMTGMSTGSMKEKIPSGYSKATLQQFTPEQMQLLQQMMGHVGPESYLSKLAGGDQSQFEQMEAPALRQFAGLQGGLASRFSQGGGGQGALGSRRSSGFQNTSTSAASNFAQDLQSNRQNLQRQALMDLGQMSQMLMGQRPFENSLVEKPEKSSIWGDIFGKFAGAIPGAAMGFLTGGPAGAVVGGASGFMNGGGSSGTSRSAGSGTSGQFGLPTFLGR